MGQILENEPKSFDIFRHADLWVMVSSKSSGVKSITAECGVALGEAGEEQPAAVYTIRQWDEPSNQQAPYWEAMVKRFVGAGYSPR